MQTSRITIRLNTNDALALMELAQREYRDPRGQAAILIREALERRGLLAAEDPPGRASVKNDQAVENAR